MANNNKEQYQFPYEINDVDSDLNERLLADFQGEKTGFVEVGPEKWIFPSKFKLAAEHFYNFESRPDDVWVATFPRSGTTWTQELVWLLCNELNYVEASKTPLTQRFPFFEFHIYMHDVMKKRLLLDNEGDEENQKLIEIMSTPCYELLSKVESPRFVKTHLPMSLLPPSIAKNGSKVIYVARNPGDVVVSYYHLNRLYRTAGYVGDFTTFYNYFENDQTPWSPYWAHLKEGWKHRNDPNVLFLFYEDMNKDLSSAVRKIAKFLGKNLPEEDIPKFLDHLNIKNFKNNLSVNGQELKDVKLLRTGIQDFVRNGQSGAMSEELENIKRNIDVWTAKNLEDTDLRFPL